MKVEGNGPPSSSIVPRTKAGSIDTILRISSLPKWALRAHKLRAHFRRFGVVENVYMRSKTREAFVQFADPRSATKALRSGQAVLNNRFIEVHQSEESAEILAESSDVVSSSRKRPFKHDADVGHAQIHRGDHHEVATGNESRSKRARTEQSTVSTAQQRKIDLVRKQIELWKVKLAKLVQDEKNGREVSAAERSTILKTVSALVKTLKALKSAQKVLPTREDPSADGDAAEAVPDPKAPVASEEEKCPPVDKPSPPIGDASDGAGV